MNWFCYDHCRIYNNLIISKHQINFHFINIQFLFKWSYISYHHAAIYEFISSDMNSSYHLLWIPHATYYKFFILHPMNLSYHTIWIPRRYPMNSSYHLIWFYHTTIYEFLIPPPLNSAYHSLCIPNITPYMNSSLHALWVPHVTLYECSIGHPIWISHTTPYEFLMSHLINSSYPPYEFLIPPPIWIPHTATDMNSSHMNSSYHPLLIHHITSYDFFISPTINF